MHNFKSNSNATATNLSSLYTLYCQKYSTPSNAEQSSSSTLTESSFLFDSCLIHRDTVMLE